MTKQKVSYFHSLTSGKGVCTLCPQACLLQEGKTGRCRGRYVREGKIYSSNYGRVSSLALDPIEKKPLYHFYPGSLILSVGTAGCNLTCKFCQNWQIAHEEAEAEEISPEDLVALAIHYQPKENIGIAYTYSEPLVWYDYILDTARLGKEKGLKNILVTNGYINPEPLEELIPYIDGVNLDIKGNDRFYETNCGGRLEPVLNTAKKLAGRVHLEVTNLLIPGENDKEEEITNLVCFLAELDKKIPLHFSRYFPQYQMTASPTPVSTLERAFALAKEKLCYVYLGNIRDSRYSQTLCPECGQLWVDRTLEVTISGLKDGHCTSCGKEADLIL